MERMRKRKGFPNIVVWLFFKITYAKGSKTLIIVYKKRNIALSILL